MSGTHIAYGAICHVPYLPASVYPELTSRIVQGPTRELGRVRYGDSRPTPLSAYAHSRPCPVWAQRSALSAYANSAICLRAQ
eukprot:2153098-Rhodomonas_salina.2